MRSIPILTLSITAAAPIAANRLVGFDDLQIGVAGKVAMGVAEYPASAAGKQVAVNVQGVSRFEVGAPLAQGALFMADANGRAVPVANGGAAAGRLLFAASAAGQIGEALLLPNASV